MFDFIKERLSLLINSHAKIDQSQDRCNDDDNSDKDGCNLGTTQQWYILLSLPVKDDWKYEPHSRVGGGPYNGHGSPNIRYEKPQSIAREYEDESVEQILIFG